MFGVILVIAIIAFLIITFIRDTGIITRKKLLNKENAQPDATIEKIEPVIYGSKRTKHYEIQVTFSDGTSYRDKCNITETGYLKYSIKVDPSKVDSVVEAALAAHKQAIENKVK